MQAVGIKVTGISLRQGRAWLAAGLPWWLGLAPVVAVAVFLRLYRLGDQFITYYPDTYEQMAATSRLLSGQFPPFDTYSPGVALFLAPVFAVAPPTLATLQAVVVAAGVALVIVSFFAARATTKDQRVALLFALVVAVATAFVFHSRLATFDVINTLLIALSVFLVPIVVRRGPGVFLAYAVLVFITSTVKPPNVLLLPALFLYSLHMGPRPLSWRRVSEHLRSKAVLTVGLALLALYAAYIATAHAYLGRSALDVGSGSLITSLDMYLLHLGQYLGTSLTGFGFASFGDAVVAALVLGLAVIGARQLWQVNQGLLSAIAYIIIIWPLAFSVVPFSPSRYMLPPFYFVLFLAAFGFSVSLQWLMALPRPWQRAGLAGYLTLAAGFFLILPLARDASLLYVWPSFSSLESAYQEIGSALRGVDGSDSVLVTSQVLGLKEANPSLQYVDLYRHSRRYGINPDSTRRLVDDMERHLSEGKTVYYLYTVEGDAFDVFYGKAGYEAYFGALARNFSLTEIVRPSSRPDFRLYRVEPTATAEGTSR